jgi:rod shape-determining protein MreD
MAELLNYPILILLLILQMTIGRNIQLVGGSADLVLLWLVCWGLHRQGKNVWYGALFAGLLLTFASAVPWYVSFVSCFFAAGMSRYFSKRFWHSPLIALFIVTFVSSLFSILLQYAVLAFLNGNMGWSVSLTHVIIPSVFMNLILALPVYAIVHDMTRWMYPAEVEA